MGKLAQRLADPTRSGVYRIESTEAIEQAAALNRYGVLRLQPRGTLPATLPEVVLVFDPPEPSLVAALEARAKRARERGACFFAAFVDPEGMLAALPPLYRSK